MQKSVSKSSTILSVVPRIKAKGEEIYKPLPDAFEGYTGESDANGGHIMDNPNLAKYLEQVEREIKRSESLTKRFHEGYRAGVRAGYEQALKDVREIVEKYNFGGNANEKRGKKQKRRRPRC